MRFRKVSKYHGAIIHAGGCMPLFREYVVAECQMALLFRPNMGNTRWYHVTYWTTSHDILYHCGMGSICPMRIAL